MPVTAKLSKSFYDALGENVADESVDWFNQVDATYRTDLRELNDLNFQRFDAKMGEHLAEFETKMERRFAGMEVNMDQRFAAMEAKMDQRFADTETNTDLRFADIEAKMTLGLASLRDELLERMVSQQQFADFRAEVSDRIGDVMKWMVALWTTTIFAVIATGVFG